MLSTGALRLRIRITLGIVFIVTGAALQLLHSANCFAGN
jgi:hypothetical protein